LPLASGFGLGAHVWTSATGVEVSLWATKRASVRGGSRL
jgi:hypothetical protein